MLMRILNATGRPRIRVRLRPTFGYVSRPLCALSGIEELTTGL